MSNAPEDLAARRYFIAAYFDDLDDKVQFLETLHRDLGRRDEALMLCSIYLDGLGNWLYPESASTSKNFAIVLIEHGGEDVLRLVLPVRLISHLPFGSAPSDTEGAVTDLIGALPKDEAFAPELLLPRLGAALTTKQAGWLENELWRGTIASVVHERIRSMNVHALGSTGGIAFSITKHAGRSIPDVGFGTLYRALKRISSHARRISEDSEKWFGHMPHK